MDLSVHCKFMEFLVIYTNLRKVLCRMMTPFTIYLSPPVCISPRYKNFDVSTGRTRVKKPVLNILVFNTLAHPGSTPFGRCSHLHDTTSEIGASTSKVYYTGGTEMSSRFLIKEMTARIYARRFVGFCWYKH
jgi:hypothetical protein